METLLIYENDYSNKFWKIEVLEHTYTVVYGKIGTVGSVKTKEFASQEACMKEANQLIQSKVKKGYQFAELSRDVIKESSIDENLFWELLDKCKAKGEDCDEPLEWLISQLTRKSVKDIIAFDAILNRHYSHSYTSDLWAAAYIVMGGCSDDCFDYFRAWLLYMGKDVYYAAIENPESLLPYFKILEEQEEIPQLEELLFIASDAYEEKTGADFDDYSNLYDQLIKEDYSNGDIDLDWDEDDEAGLRKRFPMLWDAYGETPLG